MYTSLFLSPFAWMHGCVVSLLARGEARGFCTRCERHTVWEEAPLHYRCGYCGSDPVEHSPDR